MTSLSPVQLPSPPLLDDRLAGGVWGHLAGDALGVPYEFRQADQIEEVTFGAQGSHGQPAGTWSDDGAMMLALLNSLLSVGFDPQDQARRFLDWFDRGAYTPGHEGKFDWGRTTSEAIARLRAGTPAEKAGGSGEHDNGNGSLMRILPLALVARDSPDEQLVEHAHAASRVTHGHPKSQVTCALYVLVARRILAGETDREAALRKARATLRAIYQELEEGAHLVEALDFVESWPERRGRGAVWDSFWSAWDAFAGADSYPSAVRRAVSYGNDTDTTACICGGLAGIYWGIDGIPRRWLERMRGKEIVAPLVERLVNRRGEAAERAAPGLEASEPPPEVREGASRAMG